MNIAELCEELRMTKTQLRVLVTKQIRKKTPKKKKTLKSRVSIEGRKRKSTPLFRAGWCRTRYQTDTHHIWCQVCGADRMITIPKGESPKCHYCLKCGGKVDTHKKPVRLSGAAHPKKRKSRLSIAELRAQVAELKNRLVRESLVNIEGR